MKERKNTIRRLNDKKNIRKLEKLTFGITEDVLNYVEKGQGGIKEPLTLLEAFIKELQPNLYSKFKTRETVMQFQEKIFKRFDLCEKHIKSMENPEVKREYDKIKLKVLDILTEFDEIFDQWDEIPNCRKKILKECLKLSTEPLVDINNLYSDFSYLKGAIDNHYEKKEKRLKAAVAIGTAAVTTVGIGATTYAIVDYKADEIKQPLIEIYGSEENIPDSVYNQFFTELGVPKAGATEKMKKIILSKTLKKIVNAELKETTDDISIMSLELDYGKKDYQEDTGRGPKLIETDGYTIVYKMNTEEDKKYIFKEDIYETVLRDEGRVHTTKNKESKKTRRWLESLSIDECMNIFKGNCEEREKFEVEFRESILEMENELLQQRVENLESKSDKDSEEIEF